MVTILTPDLMRRNIAPQIIRDSLYRPVEAPYVEAVDDILSRAGVSPERRPRVRTLFLSEQSSAMPVARGWMLRHSPVPVLGAGTRRQADSLAAIVITTIVLQQGLLLATWGIIGGSTLCAGSSIGCGCGLGRSFC